MKRVLRALIRSIDWLLWLICSGLMIAYAIIETAGDFACHTLRLWEQKLTR